MAASGGHQQWYTSLLCTAARAGIVPGAEAVQDKDLELQAGSTGWPWKTAGAVDKERLKPL